MTLLKTETQQAANNSDFSGVWSLESYSNSIVIRRTTGSNAVVTNTQHLQAPVAFTLSARGGPANLGIEAFQDDVQDSNDVPSESFHGHNVKVLNTSSAQDDYYLQYVAFNGTSGKVTGKSR